MALNYRFDCAINTQSFSTALVMQNNNQETLDCSHKKKKWMLQSGVVAHTCDPSSQDAKAGGL
jgi:hypothetical protein